MSKFYWRDVRWHNLWLIPILFVSMIASLIYIMVNVAMFEILLNLTDQPIVNIEEAIVLAQLFSYIMVIFAFFCININLLRTWMKQWWDGLRRYWLWIIGLYIVTFGLAWIYGNLKEIFPYIFTTETTQNQQMIEEMLSIPELMIFNFLLIVIAGPIVEEIFFRHILIGELGKKFNFIAMSIVSVLLFSAIHLVDFSNWFEIIDYLIIAIPLVYLYMKSGRNLGVAFAFHILNNLISYCISMLV
ncbi:CPBP family intramembrane glutamic endopeptidase [Staphylococcus hyicus]|uniref:CPBP family intramembrane glutamic endopeptidase n=1 Tax=Staphylococcus hyicus TaxID=1284 RepID=UPI0023670CF6|nr:CPBP family intramembrane glutamic endopeptidase [Staphylococcus hyicus]